MGEEGEEAARSFDETREQLLEGLDKARRLVKQAKFMLGGESDESPAYPSRQAATPISAMQASSASVR